MVFPFSFRRLSVSGKTRSIHIISVIVTILIPLPFTFIHLKGGLITISTPPITCFGRDSNLSVYAFALPLAVIATVISGLFVLTFWNILKVIIKAILLEHTM